MVNYYRKLFFKFFFKSLFASSKSNELKTYEGKKKCIVCLAADYGNLGDVAITYAQSKYLKSLFPEYEIVDFPISTTLSNLKILKKICNIDDIITIVGGGNMGDMYGDIELLRLMIVKSFPFNRIISFPQTIEYTDPDKNRFLLNLSKRIYGKHHNLKICAREEISYITMKELYPNCEICLVPDIVMTLDVRSETIIRDNNLITLCLRNDKEKKDIGLDIPHLVSQLRDNGYKINFRDTHIGKSIMSIEERYIELRKIWDDFSSSKLVITDRLHGMIFAFITGTPAIVLPNSNFKIEKSYKWIKECGYIEFITEPTSDLILEKLNLQYNNAGFQRSHEFILNQLSYISSI